MQVKLAEAKVPLNNPEHRLLQLKDLTIGDVFQFDTPGERAFLVGWNDQIVCLQDGWIRPAQAWGIKPTTAVIKVFGHFTVTSFQTEI